MQCVVQALSLSLAGVLVFPVSGQSQGTLLSAAFTRHVLSPTPAEAVFPLRFFSTAVKTDSRGRIITGPTSDPVKTIVGAEAAGVRAGLARFTKILFGAQYDTGRPDPGTRIDPNNPIVKSGGQHWPFVPQPFRSWPNALALTPDGAKLYVTLPGRENFPDWRVAVVDTANRRVLRWIDLRPSGVTLGTRPIGAAVAPLNTAIFASPYLVVLHEYGNFASVVNTATDTVIGEFETGFYGEDLVFNATGTRLYITDRSKDQVRVFSIAPGPFLTQIAVVSTGSNDLDRTNPRDLALSADGKTLYVANTLGHTIAAIDVANDTNTLISTMPVGGLATDVKIAGHWGIVSGHDTSNVINEPETGHGLPTVVNGVAIRNNGQALGYLPVMTDATRATTFDDLGSTLSVFETATNRFVFRYVDFGRDLSLRVVAGEVRDLGDHEAGQKIIRGSGPEQLTVKGDFLFVSQLHSDQVEVFHINQNPATLAQILTPLAAGAIDPAHPGVPPPGPGLQFTGGITPQGIAVSPDGKTVYVANMQTEDVSFLAFDATNGNLTRQGFLPVGVTGTTPDPTSGGHGSGLFATHEEVGLRWFFNDSYSDDGQKSCGHCHWQSRHDGSQWNVGANAIGGPKAVPQNKDLSDNWPQWFEGLSNDMTGYASSCNGELVLAESPTAVFPQATELERLHARDEFVQQQTAANSTAIGRPDLKGDAFRIGYYDMAFKQILWTQNETHRLPNPLAQFPSSDEAIQIKRGRFLFSTEVAAGGSGCASCHVNGNKLANGVVNDTFQDFNIHEPGVASETTVDGDGPFLRLANDFFFSIFGPPQDLGARQNISSRNTKHLRAFWDSVPRWLHHGNAHTVREILLPPDSPWLRPNERGFNFRTVRTDHTRRVASDFLGGAPIVLPTEVPITFGDSGGGRAGDGKGPIYVSLDPPTTLLVNGLPTQTAAYPEGRLVVDRLGTDNLAPLILALGADGSLTFDKQFDGRINETGDGVTVAPDDGTIYVTGTTTTFGAGNQDAFVLHLLPTGKKLLDAVTWGGPQLETGVGVSVTGSTLVLAATTNAGPPYSLLAAAARLSLPHGTLSAASAVLDVRAGTVGNPAAGAATPNGSTAFSGNFEAAVVRIAR